MKIANTDLTNYFKRCLTITLKPYIKIFRTGTLSNDNNNVN